MTLDRWRRERERDQLYAGADGGLRPLPLGRGSAWRPPTTSYWVVMRENARPCAGRGVGGAVAWGGRGGEVGEPEGAEGAHLGGVHPLVCGRAFVYPSGIGFDDPFRKGVRRKPKPLPNDVRFPLPKGPLWEAKLNQHADRSNESRDGFVDMRRVPTDDNTSDVFTKTLGVDVIDRLRPGLTGYGPLPLIPNAMPT